MHVRVLVHVHVQICVRSVVRALRVRSIRDISTHKPIQPKRAKKDNSRFC